MSDILRGPADADHYRVKRGNFSDRWYIDPLPADDVWPATDEAWPSVTTVKKASDHDWSVVTIKRIATALANNPRMLEHCVDFLDVKSTLTAIDNNGLTRDGDRGNNVHGAAESLLDNRPPVILPIAPGYEWLPAVTQFFYDYQPRLVAAEVVIINRTLHGWGYGGTFDAIVAIDGRMYLVDWKSRGRDTQHACYPHEAAQLGGYYGAQYCVVTDDTGAAVRAPLPPLDGGLIVSIRPDGYVPFPVDLKLAFENNYEPLHAFWCSRRRETKAIGKRWAPLPLAGEPAADPDRLRQRVTALIEQGHGYILQMRWPDVPWGQPVTSYDATQRAAIVACVRAVEDYASLPFHADDAPVLALVGDPDPEGGPADPAAIEVLAKRTAALPPVARGVVTRIATEANDAGTSLALRLYPTVRRFEIGRALVILVEASEVFDDALARHLLAMVMTDPTAEHPSTPVGAAMSRLTIDQARQLANLASAIGTDALVVSFAEGGSIHVEARS